MPGPLREREGAVRQELAHSRRSGRRPFEIVGFLGYQAPPGEKEGDWPYPAWVIALAIAAGGIVLTAALALPLRRREGESKRSA